MRTKEERFFEHLRKLSKDSYWILKQTRKMPKDRKAQIDGFMLAGQDLRVGYDEMKAVLEEVNYEVFGMSIEERKKEFSAETTFDEEEFRTPTFIRKPPKGKKLEI